MEGRHVRLQRADSAVVLQQLTALRCHTQTKKGWRRQRENGSSSLQCTDVPASDDGDLMNVDDSLAMVEEWEEVEREVEEGLIELVEFLVLCVERVHKGCTSISSTFVIPSVCFIDEDRRNGMPAFSPLFSLTSGCSGLPRLPSFFIHYYHDLYDPISTREMKTEESTRTHHGSSDNGRHSEPILNASEVVNFQWHELLSRVLMTVISFTAEGSLGGFSQEEFCNQRLQPLLVRLMKVLMTYTECDFSHLEMIKHKSTENSNRVYNMWAFLHGYIGDYYCSSGHDKNIATPSSDISCCQRVDGACADDEIEEEEEGLIERLVDLLSTAMTSAAGGVLRREADTILTLELPPSCSFSSLSVVFGYADYADTQTGAALWGGSMGLSLYLMETWEEVLWRRILSLAAFTGKATEADKNNNKDTTWSSSSSVFRVIEVGCGTGLVSLVAVKRLLLQYQQESAEWEKKQAENVQDCGEVPASTNSSSFVGCMPRVEVTVTDVEPDVTAEVYRSFVAKNKPEAYAGARFHLSSLPPPPPPSLNTSSSVCTPHEERYQWQQQEEGSVSSLTPVPVVDVSLFPLDLCAIPPECCGMYDLVLAGDIVYDYCMVPHIYPALRSLLKPPPVPFSAAIDTSSTSGGGPCCSSTSSVGQEGGGLALLCCGAHRDGMKELMAQRASQEGLEVVTYLPDLRDGLRHFTLPKEFCTTSPSLLILRRTR